MIRRNIRPGTVFFTTQPYGGRDRIRYWLVVSTLRSDSTISITYLVSAGSKPVEMMFRHGHEDDHPWDDDEVLYVP